MIMDWFSRENLDIMTCLTILTLSLEARYLKTKFHYFYSFFMEFKSDYQGEGHDNFSSTPILDIEF